MTPINILSELEEDLKNYTNILPVHNYLCGKINDLKKRKEINKESQTPIYFLNWLMDNCELAIDNSLWSYESEDYTTEKLFEIFNKNRCNVCSQGFDIDGECPTGHVQK